MSDQPRPEDETGVRSRRSLVRTLSGVGVALFGGVGSAVAGGIEAHRHGRASGCSSGDGIADELKRSAAFHDRLADRFGADSFEGQEVGRRDFLVDVRDVGDATVDESVKRNLEALFRDNGIYRQRLDHPNRIAERRFLEVYRNDASRAVARGTERAERPGGVHGAATGEASAAVSR